MRVLRYFSAGRRKILPDAILNGAEIRCDRSAGVVVENRSAADVCP